MGGGRKTSCQALPFQCSINSCGPVLSVKSPTAQAFVALVAATASRLALVPGLGLGTTQPAEQHGCRSEGCGYGQ